MTDVTNEDLWTDKVCAYFGGSGKPIYISTLRRGVQTGRFPRPIKLGKKLVRWLPSECRACRSGQIAARGASPATNEQPHVAA